MQDTLLALPLQSLYVQVLEAASEAKGVLVTAGEQGSSYAFHKLDRDGIFSGHIPVFDVKVEDTTGAGDAFLGGFLNAMIKVILRA